MTCRNEEKYVRETLESLELQSFKPTEVIIIDDASNDNTYYIMQEIAKRNGWKTSRKEKNDEKYSSIVSSLRIASSLMSNDYDFIMVLDGDTVLESHYIEKILQKFEADPKLGIAGGSLRNYDMNIDLKTIAKLNSDVFGCNRIYSRKCWNDVNVGKLLTVNTIIWDPEHSAKAAVRGYTVRRFDDIISHALRLPRFVVPSFSKGILSYCFGYSLPTALISAFISRDLKFLAGYLLALVSQEKKIDNNENMKKMRKTYEAEYIRMLYSRLLVRIRSRKYP